MSDIQNISEEYNYFEKLFEIAEKEQVGDLYKKDLYIMKEDLENNKSETKLKLMHDTLLQKIYCEEFKDFESKNEIEKQTNSPKKQQNNIINNNYKNTSKEDAIEKELAEELDYLKSLSRINYLTFSPLALEYFEKINNSNKTESKNIQNNNENLPNIKDDKNNNIEENNNIMDNKEEEKEKKLLDLLDFDYNSFEINNDLLFNICQGFIDVSKLKERNIKIPVQEELKEVANDSSDSSKNDEYDEYEYDEELEQELVDKIMAFVHQYENNLILKGAIIRFKEEQRKLPPKCKNKDKNIFYRKWEKEFIKLEKNIEIFEKKKREDDKKKELRRQMKYLNKLKMEKNKEKKNKKYEGYDDKLFDELEKLRKDAMLKMEKNKNKSRKKKKYNKTLSSEKEENVKTNKKYYCSGFNMYKEIINNKKRNTSSNK